MLTQYMDYVLQKTEVGNNYNILH